MKKYLLTSVISFSILSGLFGQISKGSVLLGGDFSASTAKQKSGVTESSNSGFSVSPLIGKAIKENFIVGGSLRVGYGKNKTTTNNSNVNNSYGVGVFVRKYKNFKGNVYGFLQGGADAGTEKTKYSQNNSLINTNNVIRAGISLTPGISFKVSNKLHLETGLREVASLTYQHQKINDMNNNVNNESVSNSFSVYSSLNNFTSGLYFGFRLLLNKK